MATYRKIPFMTPRRGLGALPAPGEMTDALWTGLTPGVASRAYLLAGDYLDADDMPPGVVNSVRIGAYNIVPGNAPMVAGNRRSYNVYPRLQDRSVENAGGIGAMFSPMNPNSGFLGGPAVAVVRPPKNAVPGWAGFFGWVASVHPGIYNQLRVALPDYVGDIETLRSGAAELSGLGAVGDDNPDGSVPVMPSYASYGFVPTTTLNLPKFAPYNDGDAVSSGAPTKTPDTTSQLINTISSIGSSALSLFQDQKLFNLNLQRAAQGKPPINAAAYMNANSGINVGLNAGTQQTVLLAIAGLGGIFLLSKLMKKG